VRGVSPNLNTRESDEMMRIAFYGFYNYTTTDQDSRPKTLNMRISI